MRLRHIKGKIIHVVHTQAKVKRIIQYNSCTNTYYIILCIIIVTSGRTFERRDRRICDGCELGENRASDELRIYTYRMPYDRGRPLTVSSDCAVTLARRACEG